MKLKKKRTEKGPNSRGSYLLWADFVQPLSLGAIGLQHWGVQGWEASVLQTLVVCHLGFPLRGFGSCGPGTAWSWVLCS